VSEVEPDSVGGNQRSALLRVLAEDILQCTMEEMGNRMVPLNVQSPRLIDLSTDFVGHTDHAVLDAADVNRQTCDRRTRVVDSHRAFWSNDSTTVADLTAGLGVEGRAVQDYLDRIAIGPTGELVYGFTGDQNAHDFRFDVEPVVTLEHSVRERQLPVGLTRALGRECATGSRPVSLFGHLGPEPGSVDR
jgi:hypothetical protein